MYSKLIIESYIVFKKSSKDYKLSLILCFYVEAFSKYIDCFFILKALSLLFSNHRPSNIKFELKTRELSIGIYRHTFMQKKDKVLNDENKIALRYLSLRYYLSCKIRWLLHLSEPRITCFRKIFQK